MPSRSLRALAIACFVLVAPAAGTATLTDGPVNDVFSVPADIKSPSSGGGHTIEIVPEDGTTTYRLRATDGLEPANVNGRETNSDDEIGDDGTTAEGQVVEGFQGDSYRFSGRLVDLRLDGGNATVLVDGERVDPDAYAASQAIEFVSCTEVRVHGDWEFNEIDAHGYTEAGDLDTEILSPDLSDGPTTVDLADTDLPEDSWVIDSVALGNTEDGEFVNLRNHPRMDACDEQISPNSSSSTPTPTPSSEGDSTIEVIPDGEDATYRLQVDGELEPGDVNGRHLNDDDDISEDGERATGHVAAGFRGDSYRYQGDVEKIFLLDGDATFRVNGEAVQPDPVVEYLSCTRVRVHGDWASDAIVEVDAHGYDESGRMDTEILSPDLSDGPTVVDLADADLPEDRWAIDSVYIAVSPDGPEYLSEHPNKAACDERIQPESQNGSQEEHRLEIIPGEEDSSYSVEVSGELRPGDVNGRETNSDDEIGDDGTTAEGQVAPGYQGDSYYFTGDIEQLTLESGDATFRVDGDIVEPNSTSSDGGS